MMGLRSADKACHPGAGLRVESVNRRECARSKEAVADVADRALDVALLVATGVRNRARLIAVIASERNRERIVKPTLDTVSLTPLLAPGAAGVNARLVF